MSSSGISLGCITFVRFRFGFGAAYRNLRCSKERDDCRGGGKYPAHRKESSFGSKTVSDDMEIGNGGWRRRPANNMASSIRIHFQGGDKGLLRDLDAAELPHLLFTFLLLV